MGEKRANDTPPLGLMAKLARRKRGERGAPLAVTVIGDATARNLLAAAQVELHVDTQPAPELELEATSQESAVSGLFVSEKAGPCSCGGADCESSPAAERPAETEAPRAEMEAEREPIGRETQPVEGIQQRENSDTQQGQKVAIAGTAAVTEDTQDREERQGETELEQKEQRLQSELAEPLAAYLEAAATRGKSLEFSQKLQRYCRVERAVGISLEQAVGELAHAGQLNSWARLLETALGDPAPVNWITLLRRLVVEGKQKGSGVTRQIHPQLTRARLELALEWLLRQPAGVQFTTALRHFAKTTDMPCRSVQEWLSRALSSGQAEHNCVHALASELELWIAQHMPIPSFAQWIGSDTATPDRKTRGTVEGKPLSVAGAGGRPPQALPSGGVAEKEDVHWEVMLGAETGESQEPIRESGALIEREQVWRLVTLNLNSLLASVERRGLLEYLDADRADIYAFQEVMVDANQSQGGRKWKVGPLIRLLREWGYLTFSHAGERNKAGYGGTMFVTRAQPEVIVRGTGDPEIDAEGRFLAVVYKEVIVINSYVPTLGLDLTGADRKTKFWKASSLKAEELQNEFPGRKLIWAGDMNIAPLEKDIDENGIRRSLQANHMHKRLQDELPCASVRERAELVEVMEKFQLSDAFENQADTSMGRDALGAERYTQYMHGNRPERIGQRIDLVLTDVPMSESTPEECMRVLSSRVQTEVHCSDHLPLEVKFAVRAQPGQGSVLGQAERLGEGNEEGTGWQVGDRVLVDRKAVRHVAADTVHRWIPGTLKVVTGPLMRVRISAHWLHPGARYDVGVTARELKHLGSGVEPPRFVLGEQVLHFRSKKPGTVTGVHTGTGRASSYDVLFEGTACSRPCGPNMLRAAPSMPNLAAAEVVTENMFNQIARSMASGAEHHECDGSEVVQEPDELQQLCGCDGALEEEEAARNIPDTPHTSNLEVGGKRPYSLIDTGAGPNLVRADWMKREIQGWEQRLNRKGAAGTRFKLADGAKSVSPLGRIKLRIEAPGGLVTRWFWVLEGLTAEVILGSDYLQHMGMTVDYGRRCMTSKRFPCMPPVHFDLRHTDDWRVGAAVRTRERLVLRPGERNLLIGELDSNELMGLRVSELDKGGVVPQRELAQQGVEVAHTLQPVDLRRVGCRRVGLVNIVVTNVTAQRVVLPAGTQVGEYRPQCCSIEHRCNLASSDGTRLAAALGLVGSGIWGGWAHGSLDTGDVAQGNGGPEAHQDAGSKGDSRQETGPRRGNPVCLRQGEPHLENQGTHDNTHRRVVGGVSELVSEEGEPVREGGQTVTHSLGTESGASQLHNGDRAAALINEPTWPTWDNSSDDIDQYTAPPKLDWSDEQVELVWGKSELRKELDLTGAEITAEELLKLKRLILRYRCLFEPQKKHTIRGFEVRVDVEAGARPARGHVYRHSHQHNEILKEWIDKAMLQNLITPSTSPWRAGVLCVSKNNGKEGLAGTRIVHDFQEANKVLLPIAWPQPKISDMLNDLAGARYLSALDFTNAFHQVPVKKEHQDKLTFCCRHGNYKFLVLPMGLATASAWFQLLAETIVADLRYTRSPENESGSDSEPLSAVAQKKGKGCVRVYIDDIACFSNTGQGHLGDLERLFDRLARYRARLSLKKTKFFQKELKFLGHIVSKDGIGPDPKKVAAIDAFTLDRLQKPKDVKCFLQTVAFMRKFIRGFSQVSAPLAKYLKQGMSKQFKPGLEGDAQAQAAFEDLKERLKTAPILVPPDYSKPWEIRTDGSGKGVAGALFQRDDEGRPRVVMYASRALREQELVYTVFELEFLAAAFSFSVFYEYIAGGSVQWFTDHSALQAIRGRTSGRTQRWLADMMRVDFSVVFVPGKENGLADGLSRYPIPGKSIYDAKQVPLLYHANTVQESSHGVVGRPVHLTMEEGQAWLASLELVAGAREEGHMGPRRSTRTRTQFEPHSMEDHRISKRTRLTQQERRFIAESQIEDTQVPETQVARPPVEEEHKSEREPGANAGRRGRRPNRDKGPRRAERVRIVNSKVSVQYDTSPAARLAHDKFEREQEQDAKCQKIRDKLAKSEAAEPSVHKWFFEHEGLLMRRFEPKELTAQRDEQSQPEQDEEKNQGVVEGPAEAPPDNGSRARINRRMRALERTRPVGRIVVPDALVPDVLLMFHGIPLTGHYGRDKTVQHIASYFWWKSLNKDVVDRVKGCHVCQMRKQTRPIKNIPPGGFVASAPMELVVIDTVVGLPPSDGNVRLLTVVDVFSKFSLAIPIPNENSETVGRALNEHLFAVHGYPKLLMSDRAKGFVSRGLKWLCKHLGVAKILSTGLLPTACSPVERYHRSLGATLTMVCNKAKNDWSFLVSAVVFSYNISVCETTGFSPFFLMYGRQPNLPLDVLTGLRAHTVRHKDHSYVEAMTHSLQEAYKIVRQRQLRTLERNRRVQLGLKANASDAQVAEALSKRQVPVFTEGELVSLWEPQSADPDLDHVMPKKLQYRWSGPYKVLERDGDHYYINRRGERLQANPGRLRTYHKWSEEPVEWAHEEAESETHIGRGAPTPGQLVVIPLELRRDMSRPFAIARIEAVREDGTYLVWWWGNRDNVMEGTYRPGWVAGLQARRSTQYAAENPGQMNPCTSDTTGQSVFREHLKYWGFKLQYNDRLPAEVLQLIYSDEDIQWNREDEGV